MKIEKNKCIRPLAIIVSAFVFSLFLLSSWRGSVLAMTESESFVISDSVKRIYNNEWSRSGTIVFPVGSDGSFYSQISALSNANASSLSVSYSPYGAVDWDIYTYDLTQTLVRNALYNETFTLRMPSFPSDWDYSDDYSWQTYEDIEIPFSYFFDSLNYLGVTFRYSTRLSGDPATTTNRFYFVLNFYNYNGTYETFGRASEYPWDAESTQQELDYGLHPKITWIINSWLSIFTPGSDYSYSSNLGFAEVPMVTWYPAYDQMTEENSADNFRQKEIVEKLDTVADTLNQIDQRAVEHSGGSGVWIDGINSDLRDLEDYTDRPDITSELQDTIDEVTGALTSTYGSDFLSRVSATLQRNSFVLGLISAAVGLGLVKFIIFGKG